MERSAVIAALAELIRDVATGAVTMEAVPGRLVSIAETVSGSGQLSLKSEGGVPISPPALTDKQRTAAAIQQVFEHWRRVTDKPKATLTQERASKIRARLGEGRTVRDLTDAIDGAMLSEHHVQGGYLDLVTLFKNATVTEQHMERLRGSGSQQRTEAIENSDRIGELRAALARAKSDGDVETYNRVRMELQHELRQQR